MSKNELAEPKNIRAMSLADFDPDNDTEADDLALTQREFEILKVGKFYDPRYDVFEITEDRLMRIKQNFDNQVLGIGVALDINHDPTQGAYGWINTLRVEGGKLYMTLRDIPSHAKKVFKERVFKYFSVEFAPFNKVEGNETITIPDVLRGVALTNRPVIKGMAPTFLSEDVDNSFMDSKAMNFVKNLADHLLLSEEVNEADAAFLRAQFSEAGEEDQTEEVEAKVAEVEAKVAEATEAEAEEAEAAAPESAVEGDETPEAETESTEEATEETTEEAAEEAATEEVAEEATEETPTEESATEPEALQAAELSTQLAELKIELAEYKSREVEQKLSERVQGLMLSETGDAKAGFLAPSTDALTSFVRTLSEDQFNQFSTLVGAVRSTDSAIFSEVGTDAAPAEPAQADTLDAKLGRVEARAAALRDTGVNSVAAMERAQKEILSTNN